jgi:hypothetical protein
VKGKSSPTQRTLKVLRDTGWDAWIVEYWLAIPKHPAGGVRRDLYGFVDILALRGEVTLAIQTTTFEGIRARIRKIAEDEALTRHFVAMQRAGWRVEIHGWRRPTKTIRQWRLEVEVLNEGRGSSSPAQQVVPPQLEVVHGAAERREAGGAVVRDLPADGRAAGAGGSRGHRGARVRAGHPRLVSSVRGPYGGPAQGA